MRSIFTLLFSIGLLYSHAQCPAQVNRLSNVSLCNGEMFNQLTLTGTAASYSWTNSNPSIGLSVSKAATTSIPSFVAINTSDAPLTATITATPISPAIGYFISGKNVYAINTATNAISTNMSFNTPSELVVSKDGSRVYILTDDNSNINVVNTSDYSVLATIPTLKLSSDHPSVQMVLSPDDMWLYFTSGHTLYAYSTKTFALHNHASVTGSFIDNGILVSPDGTKLYAETYNYNDALLYLNAFNSNTLAVETSVTSPDLPALKSISPDGSRIYGIDYGTFPDYSFITVLKASDLSVAASQILEDKGVFDIAVSMDGRNLYAVARNDGPKMYVINTQTNAVDRTMPVGYYSSIVPHPDGVRLYADYYNPNADKGIKVINTLSGEETTYKLDGSFSLSLRISGCAGVAQSFTVTVNPKPATPIISVVGNTLQSSFTTGNQWYLNGTAIPGATGATYVPTDQGLYSVVSTQNGCASSVSNTLTFSTIGLSLPAAGSRIIFSPNPAISQLSVKVTGNTNKMTAVLYNMLGAKVMEKKFQGSTSINVSRLASGSYMIKVIDQNTKEQVQQMILKQ